MAETMTDLERLLPDVDMRRLLSTYAHLDLQGRPYSECYAAMRQSLAPAFEQAKEEGRREGLYAANPAHPRIRGRCPRCHAESLFLGSGGYVTCSVIGCKDPGAAHDMLSGEAPPAAAAPVPSPAVPERAETPQSGTVEAMRESLLASGVSQEELDALCDELLAQDEARSIDWESRCRQVEASLATVTAERDEARRMVAVSNRVLDEVSAERNNLRQELTEARAARERAEQALKAGLDALDYLEAFHPEEGNIQFKEKHNPWNYGGKVRVGQKELDEDAEAPLFTEAYLYNLLGKEDGRSILGRLARLRAALTPTPPPAQETE